MYRLVRWNASDTSCRGRGGREIEITECQLIARGRTSDLRSCRGSCRRRRRLGLDTTAARKISPLLTIPDASKVKTDTEDRTTRSPITFGRNNTLLRRRPAAWAYVIPPVARSFPLNNVGEWLEWNIVVVFVDIEPRGTVYRMLSYIQLILTCPRDW